METQPVQGQAPPEQPAFADSQPAQPPAEPAKTDIVQSPEPEGSAHGINKRVRDLVLTVKCKNSHDQARLEGLQNALAAEFNCQGIIELIKVRDIALCELDIRRYTAAAHMAVLTLRREAARDLIAPGYRQYAPGRPGHKPESADFQDYFAKNYDAISRLDQATLMQQAEQALADIGANRDDLDCAAVLHAMPYIEPLERLIANAAARRDVLIEDLQRHQRNSGRHPVVVTVDVEEAA